jgi:hypothetical protein
MALGSTQPPTEMSTRNLPGGKGRPARGAVNLTAICEPIFSKMWDPRRLTNLWAFMACYRDSFTFLPYENADMDYTLYSRTSKLISTLSLTCKEKRLVGPSLQLADASLLELYPSHLFFLL